jgi:signal transduction histidine kinase
VQAEALSRIDAAVKQMEVWAGVCPDGFAHRLLLMQAERARLLGKDAAALYEGAVEAARKGNFLHHEALACELTGRFYASLGRENPARGFIEAARYAYQRWGAKAKVAQLAELYPWLEDEGGSEPVGPGGVQALDLDAVLQAGAAMTGEIVLDRLLQKMLAILVENAGAERGALFLDQDGSLRLHALGTAQRVEVIDAVPLDDCADLPRSVIRYAARTRETVLLHDAAASSLFRGDPLVRGSPGTSMLCVPLVRQGRMLGELYLENRRVAGAFTARRVEVLRLLSTVAATALENAVLYNTLEQKVASRTSALRLKNEELARTLSQLEAAHAQLVQSEKMAALGQLVAGIAHEINTPLGAISASTGNIKAAVDHVLGRFPVLLGDLSPQEREVLLRLVSEARGSAALSSREARQIRRALEERLEELQVPDAGDVADTLVDIGVHGEVGDLAPLLTSPRRDQMLAAAYNLTGLAKNTRTIDAALGRASKVVFALKTFAHKDHSGQKTLASVVEGLENVLIIYGSYLRQGVEVHRQFEELPQLLCLPDELQQVWINLIHNALQAMQFKGQLWLTAKKRDGEIVVSVRDDGPGIPPEIKGRIFDAFFTTKPAGEGSGLGLHICSQIVARHGGTITATSEPGSTTIEVVLPVQGGPQ